MNRNYNIFYNFIQNNNIICVILLLTLLGQNGTCLYMSVWLHGFKIFINVPLNSIARLDALRHQNHVSLVLIYRFYFSFWLKLEFKSQLKIFEATTFTSILQGVNEIITNHIFCSWGSFKFEQTHVYFLGI